MSLVQCLAAALDLPAQGLLSIVGAGGKTTLMYRLAAELTTLGLRVACTTTTKIFPPADHQASLVLTSADTHWLDTCRAMPATQCVCLGLKRIHDKISGLSCATVNELARANVFDWILVEADGARGLALKAPAEHEPVIPGASTHVLAVLGLTALGQPLEEGQVCRSGHYARLTGLAPGAAVSPESVARLCAHPDGAFKNTPPGAQRLLWLNQADVPQTLVLGREILHQLRTRAFFPYRVCLGAAQQDHCVREVWP
ncbi:MAG: putative selenium-dependent hydroxylase accessory protein YqeC [Desulfovibrionales bacterium]|nr:putative selenium-dependent hydroxylase accessory protein YqeC [Desulfovibrionales bacterium]